MTTVSDTPSQATPSPEVRAFLDALDPAAATLVILRDELYEGSWEDMETDLRARLEGRPYIFKLAHRIVDDLDRIRYLQQFETDQQVDLGTFIRIEP
jgi:hypothetical protein